MNEANIDLRTPPVLFDRKEDCCGCTACAVICPKQAINMIEDSEGFNYPGIDKRLCICCYQCLKVCPIKAAKKSKRICTGASNDVAAGMGSAEMLISEIR